MSDKLEWSGTLGESSSTAPDPELLRRTVEAVKHATGAGEFAPSFRLRDLHGGNAAFVDLIQRGHLVISFHRGVWCSFCKTAIETLAKVEKEIHDLGASQVAIVPPPGDDRQLAEFGVFPMPILIDHGLRVSSSFGLTIELPEGLQEKYAAAGYSPPLRPGSKKSLVPIPATYVVDRCGRVVMATIDTDYRNRLDPVQLLSALRCLQRRAAM
jgi:peroxiredoxin